ncbi:MAG: hypothetical protein LBS74_00600 [Oscillospiraceae bacterium]|nr:hypothetical protein [Oscillospiraceae bacterium]
MGLFTKKPKAAPEPAYFLSATNMKTVNYKVYYMSILEKILYFIIGFAVGACVGYLFYGGLAKNDGEPTLATYVLNVLISGGLGLLAGTKFLPMRTQQIIVTRKKKLGIQFRDMLEALNTSLGAGKNVRDSFIAVYADLSVQYDEGAYILNELQIINAGLGNNVDVEDMLLDFGKRSGIDDIISFANVFKICYRKGGNIKDTIRSTHEILSDKMEIREDIETIITANKNEQNIMMIMPIALIGIIKMTSPEFADNFAKFSGIMSTTAAIVMFVVAYFVGKAVLDIKI